MRQKLILSVITAMLIGFSPISAESPDSSANKECTAICNHYKACIIKQFGGAVSEEQKTNLMAGCMSGCSSKFEAAKACYVQKKQCQAFGNCIIQSMSN